MTPIEVIDTIKLALAPVDKTNKFHREYIRRVCGMVYSSILKTSGDSLMDDLDLYSKEYTSQSVILDSTRGLYYAVIPASYVSIPSICGGIRRVNSNQGQDMDFCCTSETEWSYMAGTDVQTTDTTIGYWIQRDRIWFDESMTSDIASAGVRIVLLPRFEEFADSDLINIPGASDLGFIQQVINILAPTAQVDLKANNA